MKEPQAEPSARAKALVLEQVQGKSDLGSLGGAHPIELTLHAGEVGVVFGGKETSSLFRLVMGSGSLSHGRMVLDGRFERTAASRPAQLVGWRQQIGFAFREKGLISNLTIMENVDLPARYHGHYAKGVAPRSLAEYALAETGVDPRVWSVRPSRISWEIRKKVLLARALVLKPKILILDDPSALLASTSLPELIRWIDRQKAKGTAILIGTNDYPFGLAVAGWVLNPRSNRPTTEYHEFIASTWLESAAILKKAVGHPG